MMKKGRPSSRNEISLKNLYRNNTKQLCSVAVKIKIKKLETKELKDLNTEVSCRSVKVVADTSEFDLRVISLKGAKLMLVNK